MFLTSTPTKALDAIPIAMCPKDFLFFCLVPIHGPLGKNDKDASNVRFMALTPDGQLDPSQKLCVVPTGKLGSLKGGLLNLDDFRKPLSKEDVQQMAFDATKARLSKKRNEIAKENKS